MKRLVVLLALATILTALFGTTSQKPEQTVTVLNPGWRIGQIPEGAPVIGIWLYNGEVVVIACVQTSFAGLYEYRPAGRVSRPLPKPDYWAPMPVWNP